MLLYRAEYAIHVWFHTSFRDQKEKMAFWQTSINISSSFALEKKAFHLYLVAISKEITEFICSQES